MIAGTGAEGQQDGAGATATFSTPNGTCVSPSGDSLLVSDGHRIRLVTDFAPTVNTKKLLAFDDFKISPNPVAEQLNIAFSLAQEASLQWVIYDQQGKRMKQGKTSRMTVGKNQLTISLEQLIPGMYHIQFMDSKNQAAQYSFVKT